MKRNESGDHVLPGGVSPMQVKGDKKKKNNQLPTTKSLQDHGRRGGTSNHFVVRHLEGYLPTRAMGIWRTFEAHSGLPEIHFLMTSDVGAAGVL